MLVCDLLQELKSLSKTAKVVVRYGDRYLRVTEARQFDREASSDDESEHTACDDMDERMTSNACVIEIE